MIEPLLTSIHHMIQKFNKIEKCCWNECMTNHQNPSILDSHFSWKTLFLFDLTPFIFAIVITVFQKNTRFVVEHFGVLELYKYTF